MKKIATSVVLASVLSVSGLSAKANVDSMQSNTAKIEQSDANFLFNNVETSKVAILSEQEMMESIGNVWPYLIFSTLFTNALMLNAPGPNSNTYSGALWYNTLRGF
ncbi:hypothetical protein DCO58_12370 [Helicobacter saguini]|uniref:Uncharacterized protein n=1 Tax=Helicobacter saguini TaxID=1548018 RepID=A0A099B8X6_9HELI|nr:hypothetical protein [Helicobacter saguini]MWV60915.1 hypothetical protein [Helicobacter saguini]MWV68417.1 hypothetical protein [Helicobacter saguini]MWV70119.1 hypothetical protein [Helicobacter saguini]MWV72022.1 hypothetical protein [Helicobacter saguini]TLD93754.1 hypothetical protein LS64_008145 [Helicobacter saguini]